MFSVWVKIRVRVRVWTGRLKGETRAICLKMVEFMWIGGGE